MNNTPPKTSINSIIQSRLATLINNISADFSLDKLSKSPARFNTEKLNWFNREYIKMLSLEEFALRSFELKNNKNYPELNLRKGVYIYLVDLSKSLILTCDIPTAQGQDGIHYMLGGGMDEGESEIQTLLREIEEESLGKIKLDAKNCKYIMTCKILGSEKFMRDGIEYDGKEMSFWFCEFDSSEFGLLESIDTETKYDYKWQSLDFVLFTNTHLTYPIYKEFCEANGIECFEPNEIIKTQYLAWNLDKSRVTTLNELGIESDCILKYETPERELIKWKKITLEESLANLSELLPVLKGIYAKLVSQREELLEAEINQLPTLHENLTKLWEDELKSWINQNSKDAGSYFWPLRTVLSGKAKSPSPFEILAILSWEEVESRISGIAKPL
jgi:Anticodon binding domain/NUDIX domain